MYTCHECERPINQATEICPYCGADLTVPAVAEEEPRTFSSAAVRGGGPNLIKTLLRWSVVVAAMWFFLWFILPEKKGDAAARAETTAIEALEVTRAALTEFAEARGGGYPASLEALADRLRSTAQRAQGEGYRLEYVPGPIDAEGLIRTYTLAARPGHYGYRNFFADETGVIRATRENRAATAKDPPIEK